jgi:phosphoadenosine phosphosulfate reductase
VSAATAAWTEFEIKQLAHRFEPASVEELLEWAVNRFGSKLVMTSSFGPEGIVLMDKLMQVASQTPVIFLDTGFHFAETYQLRDRLRARYSINLVEQQAALTVEQQDALYGERLYEREPDRCCQLRKVEPLRAALEGYGAWLAALRRDQSPTRARISKVEWNAKHNLVKLNPLANWTRAQVWEYLVRYKLPYNPLLDDGYTSIGCAPCTRRTMVGAHERSGRWAGQGKLECGIHL